MLIVGAGRPRLAGRRFTWRRRAWGISPSSTTTWWTTPISSARSSIRTAIGLKVDSAAETLARLDHIKVDAKLRVDATNIDGLIAGHDLVIDGSDFRYAPAVHDACYRA